MADIALTSTTVTGGKGISALAAEALTAGDVVYLDTAGAANKCNNSTALLAAAAGIALNDAALNQPVGVLKTGVLSATSTPNFTVGAIYAVSPNDGKIAPVADVVTGKFMTILGWGKTATSMNLSIAQTNLAVG